MYSVPYLPVSFLGFTPDPNGLVLDQRGNLYGTTYVGGAYEQGVVFKLTPKGEETVLYSFGARNGDGTNPAAGLVFDQKGNLYGTTYLGGARGGGVVFKLTPKGKETVLYSFCAQTNCTDGANPAAGLVFDQKGNLYGTTSNRGAACRLPECGVVFKLTPQGKYMVLYRFCAQTNCADGAGPTAGLVFDQKGNLYGTASVGGTYNNYDICHDWGCGVVFELTPKGKETVLYSFCAQDNCQDGARPSAGLIFDQKGNLYGTTAGGGVHSVDCDYGYEGCGVVFKLTPEGKEAVLHYFCAQGRCTDGANPDAAVVFDQKGNLYGTAFLGGANYNDCDGYGCGVVFKLTP
jgi:uncharacterized repeat protein (TIGR03803 family)